MNWEMIASTGEWAGAFAVVATLFYLARQIKQQNEIAKHNTWQSVMEQFNQLNLSYDSNKLRILRTGKYDPDSLSDEDAAEFSFIMRVYHNSMLVAFRAYKSGYMNETEWDELAQAFGEEFDCPGGRQWIEGQKLFDDFFAEINSGYRGEVKVDHFLGRADETTEQA